MNETTLEALRASIAKWEANAEAKHWTEYKSSGGDCPLCLLFNKIDDAPGCDGCPIFEKAGKRFCVNTPYVHAAAAFSRWADRPHSVERRDIARERARDEAAFLRSLLPEGES